MQTCVNELKGERSKIWDHYQLYENTHNSHQCNWHWCSRVYSLVHHWVASVWSGSHHLKRDEIRYSHLYMCLAGGICAAGVLAHREWCWGTGCIACSLHDWRQSLIAHSHLSSNSTWKKTVHMVSHDVTWSHMISHDVTWSHMVCRKENCYLP